MKKVTVVEVQVGVRVKEGESPADVQSKVSAVAFELKEKLGDVDIFRIQTNEVPVQEQ